MAKQIHLNAFSQCSICHHSKGQWKHPADRSSLGYKDVNYWVDLAKTLERGCFDSLFLADVHGTYNVYKGSRDTAVRHTVQFPSNDPTLVISAMAYATKSLGFACTYSTSYFAPYQTAKLFSTLDHLTNGRIAWNVVTSYLQDANENFGIGEQMAHDERYDRADEYMEVVYKLWEHSWEEDAAIRDMAADVHNDPQKVHEINHQGKYFNVPGPHMCEPSLQRTPVLFQAGGSPRGVAFAGKHAECVFGIYSSTESTAQAVKKIRDAAVAAGRQSDDIKYFPGITVTVAASDEEARLKFENYKPYRSPEGALALFSGWAGVDLSQFDLNRDLRTAETDAIQGILGAFNDIDSTRDWTLQDAAEYISIGSVMPKFIGSPTTIADELERWMDETDCDGFNLSAVNQPTGFNEFVDMVVPELQRRGRLRKSYTSDTLREHYFGVGRPRLPENHNAYEALPPWKK
ncbi:MAG: LLM class flavin-dependent oxidoreductase [Gammaproteobacteria bacterium]